MAAKFVLDNTSPYYVHPLEGSGISITAVVFNGENYDLWEKAVTTAFRSKNKLGFIDGSFTLKADAEQAEKDAWMMVNSTICSWLLNVTDPKLRSTIAYTHVAKTMWDDIKKRYGSSDIPKKHSLKTKIANCKQGKGMSVVDYYSELVGYWNELDGVAKRNFCNCGKCECKDLWPNIIKKAEEEKAHQFLMGLDDDKYSTVRGHILAMDPSPILIVFII